MNDTLLYVPEIDSSVPLPKSEALPEISPHEELEMRARTIKLLSDLSCTPIAPTDEEQQDASKLARAMIEDPKFRPDYSKYSDPTMAYLAGMIQKTNVQLVDELSELKLYCVNKLLLEVENAASAKDRIAALRLLGDIDGIDAYRRRTEMTVIHKPIEEVEKEIKNALEALEVKVIEDRHENI